jgi:hypothetical protein
MDRAITQQQLSQFVSPDYEDRGFTFDTVKNHLCTLYNIEIESQSPQVQQLLFDFVTSSASIAIMKLINDLKLAQKEP